MVNPGGPGARGTTYAAAGGQVFREPLLDGFDIVGFDPRGVGASAPVDCLSDAELDDYLGGDPTPDTAEERADYRSTVLSFGPGCVAGSGPVVGHVTTIEAARDMDVLRSALGEETLSYFGASYGTKLGATYAELFPDKVGRFVLDGAVDVSLDATVDGARAGHRVRDRAAGLRAELPRHDRQLLPRRHRRRGPGHDHRAARARSRRSRCPRATAS